MVIIRNIPGLVKILSSLPGLTTYKKNIDAARAAGDIEKEKENILGATIKWSNYLVDRFGIDLTVYGRENLPDEGPVVYVCNHQGYADIPILCAVLDKFQVGFIAKDNLKQLPLYGTWMRRIRSVMIKRDDSRASLQAISEGVEYIKQGFSLIIFPEGTRSKDNEVHEFKKGSLKLATKPGVPIVPLTINGSRSIYEDTGVLKPGKVDVLIHPPVPTADMSRQEEKELTEKMKKIVSDGLEELKTLGNRDGDKASRGPLTQKG